MGFREIAQPAATPKFRQIAANKPTLADDVFGGLSTLYRAVPGADEANDAAVAFIKTAADIATGKERVKPQIGKPIGYDIYKRNLAAQRARSKAATEDFGARRPMASSGVKGVGLAFQAAPALLSGGATAAPSVASAAPASRGLLAATARRALPIIQNSANAAVSSGLAAQVAGLAGEGTLNERLEAANEATIPAMLIGGALPPAMAAAGAARRAAASMGKKVGSTVARSVNRAAGGSILDPAVEAAKRLGEALKADGLGPKEVRVALESWRKTGASSPALIDLAGENTRALLRAAAARPGGARNAAVQYADEVAGDLQDAAIARTRALTPMEARPADEIAEALRARQGQVANDMYAEPYAQPVRVSDDLLDALSDDPGRAALRRARTAAVARRNEQQVAEIDRLLEAGDGPRGDVSGGTLDRIRIAMAGRAAKAQQSPDTRDIAGGLFARAADIDQALDEIPGLQPARQTYRGIQAQRDALELGRTQPFGAPDAYSRQLDELLSRGTPEGNPYPVSEADILGGAQAGIRSELERAIGAPAEGSTGVLNRIASGTNPRRVLEDTFGQEDATLYRDALSREIDRLQNARFISPNSGSQTAPRLFDETLVDAPAIPTSPLALLRVAIDKIRRGATLTDAEREALVALGTRRIEPGVMPPDVPVPTAPERLLSPAERQRLARALAIAEGSRAATADR